MGVFNDDDAKIKISGAGVLIVEEYKSNNLGVPCILVVRNRSSKELSDFGGTFDSKHSHISDTASAELLEESRNLIKIPAAVLRRSITFDIGGKPSYADHRYRVYVIKAQNIASKYYNLNKQIIDADPNAKNYFKETDLIVHIPISNIDFSTLLDRKSVYIKDVHNKSHKISMRLRKILSTGQPKILDAIKTDPIVTSADLVQNTGRFDRTYSFVYSDHTEKN